MSSGDSLLSAELVIREGQSSTITPRYRRAAGTPYTTSIVGTLVRTGDHLSYANSSVGEFAAGDVSRDPVTFEQNGGIGSVTVERQ